MGSQGGFIAELEGDMGSLRLDTKKGKDTLRKSRSRNAILAEQIVRESRVPTVRRKLRVLSLGISPRVFSFAGLSRPRAGVIKLI